MFFFNNRFKIFRFFSTLIFHLHLFILRSSCNYGRRCVKLFTESVNILRSFFRVNLQSAAECTDNISRYFLGNRVRNHQFIIEFPWLSIRRILTDKCPKNASRKCIYISCRAHLMIILILFKCCVTVIYIKFKLTWHSICLGNAKAFKPNLTVPAKHKVIRANTTVNNTFWMKCFKSSKHGHKHNSCLFPKNVAVRIAEQKFTKWNSFHIFADSICGWIKFKHIISRNNGRKIFKFAYSFPKSDKRIFKLIKRRFKSFPYMNINTAL